MATFVEVMSTLSRQEIHELYVALEVMSSDVPGYTKELARNTMSTIANVHHWDTNEMMDVVEEAYNDEYCK